MKRLLAAVLAIVLVLSLAACGEQTEPAEAAEQIAARELDKQVWGVVTEANDQLQALDDVVSDVANRGDTDVLGVMISVLQAGQDSLDSFGADAQAAILYIGAVRAYTANARVVFESVKSYLDNGNADDYAKFAEYLGKVGDLTDNAVEKRKAFLVDAGFSESEIANFPAEVRE